MSLAQSALRIGPHVHPFKETCPTCDQPVPNEKAKDIRERAAALEKRLADEADARAALKFAADKAELETTAKARLEQAERDKAEAVEKANAEAVTRVEAAKVEGQKLAETGFIARLQAAEKAKADAERAKADSEAVAARKVAAAEQAAKRVEAERDTAIEVRVREVREAMEKDKADTLAKKDSENDEKTRKLLEHVHSLERKLEEKRADELGEGAHIQLLDALKKEFPGDDIRRIRPGASGADILHTVMRNGQECGAILWESKNATGWRDDYVSKLVRDQTAAKADHAVLSTFKFPAGTAQVTHRDGIVIVNPARAVAIAHMIRKQLLLVHTLRLSKTERLEKMAALYDFMTSERCALLLNRIDLDADALLKLQAAEMTFHQNHWKTQGLRYKSIQKAKADLDIEVGAIIGGAELVG